MPKKSPQNDFSLIQTEILQNPFPLADPPYPRRHKGPPPHTL